AREGSVTGTFQKSLPEAGSNACTEIHCENAPQPEPIRQSVVITGDDVTLKMPFGGISMTYTSHGDYLLGKTVLGTGEMYYPIYVQDENTVILSGEKYVRVEA
ncbi:MAG: hypothetical protein ACO1QR_10595, partial [Chthoniobacteraceae bacterium]